MERTTDDKDAHNFSRFSHFSRTVDEKVKAHLDLMGVMPALRLCSKRLHRHWADERNHRKAVQRDYDGISYNSKEVIAKYAFWSTEPLRRHLAVSGGFYSAERCAPRQKYMR